MRIDFIMQSLNSGGAERVLATLANELCKNHTLRIITFHQKTRDPFYLDPAIERLNIDKCKRKNKTWQSIENLAKFYRLKSNQPQILISFIHSNNLIATIVAKILNIKVIVSEHTNHTVITSKKVKWTRQYVYRWANKTTVLTNFDIDYYKKYKADVCVMPNPIEIPKVNLDFVTRDKCILAVGDLNRYEGKGFDNLLYATESILKNNIDWSLKLVGGGEYGLTELKKIVDKLNIKKQVIFLGFCNDINGLMQRSQIFVLPSKYEGLPMGLMEALANGMSSIAYDCPSGPSDLINDNVNGLLIENQNREKLENGISKLINDENLRKRLGDKGPESLRKYELSNVVTQWNILFDEVITDNGTK